MTPAAGPSSMPAALPYLCVCSYPFGPHLLHCVNANWERQHPTVPCPDCSTNLEVRFDRRFRGCPMCDRGNVPADPAEQAREREKALRALTVTH